MGYDIHEADNKVVQEMHLSTGHGHSLYIEFKDGTQLVIWSFETPDQLQMVLWNPSSQQIIKDMRSAACKEYTEMVYRKLANRNPPVKIDAPFMAYHRADYVAD